MYLENIKKLFLPDDALSAIRLIVSLLSVLALFKYAVDYSYTDTLNKLIFHYEALLTKIFQPIMPLAKHIANYLGNIFNFELELQEHWRHVFVLMGVYFMSRVKGAFDSKLYTTGYFRLILGLTIALLTAICTSMPTDNYSFYLANLIIAYAAIIGMLLYELFINVWYSTFFREMQAKLHARPKLTWIGEFINLSTSDTKRALGAFLIIAIILYFPPVLMLPLPGLLILTVIMLTYGFFWLFWAWKQTILAKKNGDDNTDYWANSDAVVGKSMVSIFGWAGSTILMDAGSQILLG